MRWRALWRPSRSTWRRGSASPTSPPSARREGKWHGPDGFLLRRTSPSSSGSGSARLLFLTRSRGQHPLHGGLHRLRRRADLRVGRPSPSDPALPPSESGGRMEGGSSKVFATAPASIGEKRSTIPPHVCACARSTCRRESGQVAARTDTSKGDAKGDAGVLVPTDGGVDLLARPRNGGILFFEQLLRPHIRRKGLHGDIRWWPNTDRLGRRRSSA